VSRTIELQRLEEEKLEQDGEVASGNDCRGYFLFYGFGRDCFLANRKTLE